MDDQSADPGSGLLRRYPIASAVVYLGVLFWPTFLVGAYGVRLQKDLGFGTAELGFVSSAFFVTSAVTAWWVGPLVDRAGASSTLRIGAAVTAVSSVTIGWLADGWPLLAVGMGLYGVANALCQLAVNRLLVRRAGGRQGKAFGTKQAAVPMASLLVGFFVAATGTGVHWRTVFLFSAVPALLIMLATPRRGPRAVRAQPRRRGAGGWRLLRLSIAGGLAGAAGNSIALLIVDTYDYAGMSEAAGAAILGIGSALAMGNRLAMGWKIDRSRSDGYAELLVLLALGTAGFAALSLSGGNRLLLVVGALVAFGAGWGWNGVLYFVSTRDPEVQPATASGKVLAGVTMGSMVGPLLIATVADHVGYGAGWGAATALMAAGAGLTWLNRMLVRRAA